HCAVLKQRPTTHHPRKNQEFTGAGTEGSSFPQTPNSVPDTLAHWFHVPRRSSTSDPSSRVCRVVNVPPMSNQHRTCADVLASDLVPKDSVRSAPYKGGDPAAPSGTATLLRLRPNRQSHLRQPPPTRGWATGFGCYRLS